ncbi:MULTISPECIES: NAD+ synthase [unclassified Leptolyngbya]|uniref:NAD+ synthase n=1 Tax=unclassified Leptolyngbya TaxID=2650499 RepID=UPI00168364E6|nr:MULTISPECIES: NAD+ synthase [unclassified Leptolyngbya]MBD1912255.1 NAD+ synthase [Leptolyngbya sp. FACHB-8]MBD2155146.1 NAD+ synthase [Leptolyngbya sp. FACHB-16]
MKIAIAQLNPTIGDLAGNAQRILEAAQQAIAQDARLLLTTELALCGYPPRDLLMQPSFITTMESTLEQLARDLPPELAVLVGTVERNDQAIVSGGKPLYNTAALLEGGQVQQYFRKRLLPTYDVFDEDRYFERGNASDCFQVAVGDTTVTVGVTICEDLWNDEEFWGKRTYNVNPVDDLAAKGADLVVNLSASPFCVGKQHMREAMLHHGAKRCHLPILYANQVGGNDDLIFDGNSVAFNRHGEVVERATSFETDLRIVTFDPNTRNIKRGTITPLPECPEAEIWGALVLGVRDYVQKCGFQRVVLGLSGGIDSSLVAAIATAALGSENVLGILMPSPYSSDHSITDALSLADNLGIQTHTLPIEEPMKAFDKSLEPVFAGTQFGIAEENIQSRIRGVLLMAVSNKLGHLLISTGNKSEMAVGYCTLYGDMNGGLAAIADVPKTWVYSVCQWLNEGGWQEWHYGMSNPQEVIPNNVITKPPSAELKPGQVDQDSLPSYDVLDDILDRFVEDHQSPAEIVAAGHDPAVVDKVVRLVTIAEFKRKQAAPGLKISDRAFGSGWRMPIANRWRPSVAKSNPVSVS